MIVTQIVLYANLDQRIFFNVPENLRKCLVFKENLPVTSICFHFVRLIYIWVTLIIELLKYYLKKKKKKKKKKKEKGKKHYIYI